MGEGCFHPQLGYIEKPDPKPVIKMDKKELEEYNSDSFKSAENDLIQCSDNYFDIFCGSKKSPNKKFSNFQVWIDVSASMRNIDYMKDNSTCYRKIFAQKLLQECSDVDFYVFNTSFKQMGTLNNLCTSVGGNNQDHIMKWIEASTVKNLLLITDIDEANAEFLQFLESKGAKFHGLGSKRVTFADVIKNTRKIKKYCL